MHENTSGPAGHRIVAMASSRQSWWLVSAYLVREHPPRHRAPSPSLTARLRGLISERVPSAGLGVIRPADLSRT